MKLIKFSLDERMCDVIGIYASRNDDRKRLIPSSLHYKLEEVTDLYFSKCEGFFISSRPVYILVIFSECDLYSVLNHESGHIARRITWDIGDKIVPDGDESYAMLQTF